MDKDSMKSAGDILKSILSERQSEEAQEYYRFFSAWDEIIGENLAGRARAKELKGSTLIVEVDHPGWIQLLEMRQTKILHELRERFPALEIEKIRFYVAGEPNRPASPTEPSRETQRPYSGAKTARTGEDNSAEESRSTEAAEYSSVEQEKQEESGYTGSESSKNRLDSVLERLGRHIGEESGDEVEDGKEGGEGQTGNNST